MELANGRLRLNKAGNDVPIIGLTPAEALVLHVLHQANNGGSTFGEEFEKIQVTGEAQTVVGVSPEEIIPAVEAVPAVEACPAVAAKPAVAYKPAVPHKPATVGTPAVGTPSTPSYKPAIAGTPEIPGQPEVLAQDAVEAQPAVAAVAAVAAQPQKVKPAVTKTRPRTDVEEVRRLTAKYGRNVNKKGDRILKLIWPEMSPKLPQKFSDLDWKNLNFDGVEVGAVNYATGAPLVANK